MTAWVNDLKYAVRQLRKSPSSTAVAVLTLALCIAANLAIFAVTDAILIRSLPYPEADRLAIAYQDYPTAGFEHQGCALATYYDWRDAIGAFASTSASRSGNVVVNDTPGRTSQRVPCERVSPEFFETLGVKPAMGRFFTDEETDPARSSVVGAIKQNTLEETAPGAVYFPYRDDAADNVYVVARTSLAAPAITSAVRRTVARVNPQVPLDDVRTMQSRIDSSLIQRRSPALLAGVFASIALLLTALGTYGVIAYATAQRQREIGVRMALGARPLQVLAQFLATSAKLLAAGLILGVAGAWRIGRAMQSFLFGTSAVDIWVLATTIGVVLVAVLLACFVPACRAARVDPMEALRYE